MVGLLFLFLGILNESRCDANWPPEGNGKRYEVTRDTGISSVGREKNGNCGASWKLKLKGQQEFILFDIDPSDLRGKLITGAVVYFNTSASPKAPILRTGVSSVAGRWREGFLFCYLPLPGASCFNQAGYKVRDWAYPGSSLMDVVFSHGHTLWGFANASRPDDNGWQEISVSPDVVAARVAGLSYGFCAADEVGSEWRWKNQQFSYFLYPNRYVYSSEHFNKKPWMKIWTNGEDHIGPDRVSILGYFIEGLPPGEALVKWVTPADKGGGRTLGFNVRYKIDRVVKEMPRYLIPMAGQVGETVSMHIQDLNLPPGKQIELLIRGVDSAGNEGDASVVTIKTAPLKKNSIMEDFQYGSISKKRIDSDVWNETYAIVDLLDKINPVTGEPITPRPAGYQWANHLFNRTKKKIKLQSARNETVCFQVNVKKVVDKAQAELIFPAFPELKAKVLKAGYVDTRNGEAPCPLPDPLIPLKGQEFNLQKNGSFVCELFVPHDIPAGIKHGKLSIWNGEEKMEFDVELEVYNFTLPDKLSFVPEMNAYGTADPYKSYDYYKLAHEHRTCLNRLPYNWAGEPAFAPDVRDGTFDWEKWDERIGPLLDGSAFKEMKRANEPVDVFYLPFNENWPVNIFQHFKPSYWADEAFSTEYDEKLKEKFQTFADHFREHRWFDTVFQFYLNNKITYRGKNGSSSAPWHFDEPFNTQDFWALRWYGKLWKDALSKDCDPRLKMLFRADISYSESGRNILWGITNMEYLGGNNHQKTRMIHDRQILNGPVLFAEYGAANRIDQSNVITLLWCLSAWFKGADGVLPWQTMGTKASWKKADQNAIFYPCPEGPVPSLRLKAFMAGQQLIEYCTIFCDLFGVSRQELKQIYDKKVKENHDIVDPALVWKFRSKLARKISELGPAYRRSWYAWGDIRSEKGTPIKLKYVTPSPEIKSNTPECNDFSPL